MNKFICGAEAELMKLATLNQSKKIAVSSMMLAAILSWPLASFAEGVASAPQAEQYRQQEMAGIIEGTYRSQDNSGVTVLIKKELSRYAVNFYAIMNSGNSKTGIFKVDAINESTMAFTQINMGAQNIIKTNDESQPSYSAQFVYMKDQSMLVLTATSTGQSNGCPQSLRLSLDANSNEKWVSLSDITAQSLKINRDAQIDLILTGNGPLKEFSLNIVGGDDLGTSWSGQYLVREQIAGVGLMRKRQLDSMQASGFSLSRYSVGTLISMKSKSNKPVIKLVQLQPGQTNCLSNSSNIK
jgi:hypothetical protein